MVGPRAAIELARAGKRLLVDGVQIDAERSPFALNQNRSVFVSHANEARMCDPITIHIDRQIAFAGLVDFRVAVVSKDRCDLWIANPKSATREHPAVAI